MNLVKEKWNKEDENTFNDYLETFKQEEKREWSKKIINTEMPILALPTPKIKEITNQILKGNFISFLDLNMTKYYENIAINGFIIAKISDFKLMEKYLDKYVTTIDNWACCDLLSFNYKDNEENLYNLALKYLKSDKPFIRRVGLNILFGLISNPKYINRIFHVMNSLYNETEYYVNMMNAWIFCECFIKNREETIKFLKTHKLNKFTINKGISKCRDSFRVTPEDKEMLLKYKIAK